MSRPLKSIVPQSNKLSNTQRWDEANVRTAGSATRLRLCATGPGLYGGRPDRDRQQLIRFRVHLATQLPTRHSPGNSSDVQFSQIIPATWSLWGISPLRQRTLVSWMELFTISTLKSSTMSEFLRVMMLDLKSSVFYGKTIYLSGIFPRIIV